jgi:hypothetical protein
VLPKIRVLEQLIEAQKDKFSGVMVSAKDKIKQVLLMCR